MNLKKLSANTWLGLALLFILLVSLVPLAKADGVCTGNSCNDSSVTNEGGQGGEGGAGGTGVGIGGEGGTGVGVASSHSAAFSSASNRTDVDVTSVNVNSASAKGGNAASFAKGGTALSGAYSGGNQQNVTVTDSGKMHYSGSYEVKNVPNPPDVIANPTAPCRVSIGIAGSGVGFGFGVGSSVLDEGCNRRENSRLLHNLGETLAAKLILCNEPEIASVLPACKTQAANAEALSKIVMHTGYTNPDDGSISLVGR